MHSQRHSLSFIRILIAAMLISAMSTAQVRAQDETDRQTAQVHFRALDLWLDSGTTAIAAYQVEITYDTNLVKIVGIEGGETNTYSAAPFFDRKGFETGRIIIAAFAADDASAPAGHTRVARIHVAFEGPGEPVLKARLMIAAKPGGERVRTKIELQTAVQSQEQRNNGEGD